MTTKLNNQTILYGIVLVLIASIMYLLGTQTEPVKASGFIGVTGSVASSSSYSLTSTARVLFATTTCAARIITTQASPIMLTFSDYAGQTPTALYGHLQAASTTVAYESGIYGCGLYKVYSFTTATTTVTETQ